MCGQNFQISGVHILRKCIKSRNFYSSTSPFKTYPQVLVITPRQKDITYSVRKQFFENLFSPKEERGGGHHLLDQNSIRK